MDFHFGVTLHLGKEKKPRIVGKVFYSETSKGPQHIIELHDVETAGQFIKGMIPPYPGENMTQTEKKEQPYHG